MRILIVGGAGYIGSHVAREFLDAGHEVAVFDNLSSGRRDNLFPEARFVEGDILDYPALLGCMRGGFDALVHLAAAKAAGESMLKPEKYALQNLNGTVHILNAALEAGVGKVVFSSSAATYGEPKYLPIDEKHPTEPENFYGYTKLEVERLLGWYDRLRGLKFAALRYFNAAGYDVKGRIRGLERDPANLLPVVMEAAAGMRPEVQVFGDDYPTRDGTGVRDYVHVSDLARGHVAALEWVSREGRSLVVNLGSEKGISVLEIIEEARRVTGRPIPARIMPRRPGDPAQLYASSALARELLGWEARHSDVGSLVATTWEAYRASGALR
ncbi:MAG TPA: UDP-glucose 4-epimerase GalE [Spirochaetales bacterium]|nr:UDP-glucose 4-epimerase GalE [Spirochaetales bacterium]HRY55406.1 UDP-glucose 4-epimerase GalE [Spirochaetia bacterium]